MPYTSNKKPGGLDAASSVGNDTIVIEQSGSVLKATVSQLEDRVFGSKTAVTSPDGSEAVVVRTSGNLIRQVALSNIVPALNITDAKVAAGAAIVGSKINPNFGSQTVQTTGQVSTGSLAVSGNTTMGGTLVVTGALTANGGINATITGTSSSANQLTTARNIAATTDVAWNVNFNGSADVTAAATIQPNVVTDAKLRTGGACSVVGRSANSTGNVADIAASADNQVLRRVSGALGFGTIPTDCIADDAVTFAKMQNSAVAGLSVVGRGAATGGDFAEINAATDAHVLRRSGSSLAFGQVATGGIADSAITLAKLAAAVANALIPVGTISTLARNTAPTGWLAANGGTFGSASSGATSASADYEALFTLLWGNGWTDANLPILTSAGAASTRGLSAAADWAANKRLTLPNLQGIFVRGSDSQTISGTTYSGTFAGKQTDAVIAHTHSGTTNVDFPDHAHSYQRPGFAAARGSGGVGAAVSEFSTFTGGANARHQHEFATSSQSPAGADETRPANIALLYCIKF
jgi:hypothetical protein